MRRVLVVCGFGAFATMNAGCSIITLDAPPSTAQASEPWRRQCRKAPTVTLVDAGAALGGGLLAYTATNPEAFGGRPNPDLDTAEKILGYTALGVFGASAVYGLYVTSRCGSDDRPETPPAERTQKAPAPSKGFFPASVLTYQFGESSGQAQQACIAGGGAFSATDGYSFCRATSASLARPDVRFEFRFGQLSKITLLYPTGAEQLRSTFQQVFAQAKTYYGAPRVGPEPWAAACTGASSAQCLQNGERPGRSVWTWADGEVELVPTAADQAIYVELRYSLYDRSIE